ncbi:Os10g0427700 [Oryza sativa Japonica Group]|uniref:Os10g0427700 protein n=2 Tax=Oryza sativa subsp. japonica TaxID=39947 RepID=Q0IXK0_ORYSJ|nr:Os10g0427700 [Oryza sativa Japonica Group]BAT10934.1 Os10g0427700 [Oryza sativa Japonica Group]|eukprot:NP_001064651.1 Os10g0427700 [Oryza sativa Japonica Group]
MLAYDVFLRLHLRQRVGVHEAEQQLEHLRLHVFNVHDSISVALLHRAVERRPEHRRPRREHAPVRGERLAADLKHHIRALLGLQQVAELLVHVGRGHGYKGFDGEYLGRLLGADLTDDDNVAPDGERIVPKIIGLLEIYPFDELHIAPTTRILEIKCLYGPVFQRRLLLHLVSETKLELGLHRQTHVGLFFF